MVFEGADVPLTEDVIKRKIEFVKSWTEWAGQNFDIIKKNGFFNGSAGTSVLYTVPPNNTLYITFAYISATTTHASPQYVYLQFSNSTSADSNAAFLRLYCRVDENSNMANNYTMPLKIEAGQKIALHNQDSLTACVAGFIGFLVPKRLI